MTISEAESLDCLHHKNGDFFSGRDAILSWNQPGEVDFLINLIASLLARQLQFLVHPIMAIGRKEGRD